MIVTLQSSSLGIIFYFLYDLQILYLHEVPTGDLHSTTTQKYAGRLIIFYLADHSMYCMT